MQPIGFGEMCEECRKEKRIMRKFEKVERIKEDIQLPKRSTEHSVGYDFFAIENCIIEPLKCVQYMNLDNTYAVGLRLENNKPTLIKTGIKAKMEDDDCLQLCNRSSNPNKGLILANGVGIIESDYYGNKDNDGEIMFAYINISNEPVYIRKGDKIGQGVFYKRLLTDDDVATGERTGGFGSTGK